MNRDKELYKQLRALPWEKLWSQEVPRFDAAGARERLERVAVIRAVGVLFSERKQRENVAEVKAWLHGLLRDPQEKIRRYAAAALPKIGADADDERQLLALAKSAATDREKRQVGKALGKIGGRETLKHAEALPPRALQRVRANVARAETPSSIRLDAVFKNFADIQIHLRCRSGLEKFVEEEAQEHGFRVKERHRGLILIAPRKSFTLSEILKLRCFDTLAFSVNRRADPAAIATSSQALKLFKTFTEGPIRYRIDFLDKGHQRAAVAELAQQIHARQPELINGGGAAPWTLEIRGPHIAFSPKISPDPRFAYRRRDVPAASHPPLAACMARLAGRVEHDIIWDPFCGSGLELIERAQLGGVHKIIGTDLSAEALEVARQNVAAANLVSTPLDLVQSDFRQFDPGKVSLIITNPPMGRRVPIPNLRQLIADLFQVAAKVLKPGGRIILANPVSYTPSAALFRRDFTQVIDMGGFHCRLEKYSALARQLTTRG